MKKLKREKLKIKITWKIANEFARSKLSKLKRFREQKHFFKKREQKMFNNIFNDVKKSKRFKKLKNVVEIIFDLENLNDFLFECFIVWCD